MLAVCQPSGLTYDQQGALKALVTVRIEAERGRAATHCWSALKARFGWSYKEIALEQCIDAVSLVARVVLEGELLAADAPVLAFDFPVSRWLAGNPRLGNRQLPGSRWLMVSADMLCDVGGRSPTMALLCELKQTGYDVGLPPRSAVHAASPRSFPADVRCVRQQPQSGHRLRTSEGRQELMDRRGGLSRSYPATHKV